MDLETLYTSSKWDILKHLGTEPLSPLQLAERSSTSLANISQQLRLLELAGLVKSKRVPNRDKGLPRLKYSLAQDQSYLIATASDFVEKRLLKLSPANKVILRIWFYDDPDVRYALEKSFWQLEPQLQRIERLGVHDVQAGRIRFCIVGKGLELPQREIVTPGGTFTVSFDIKEKGCNKSHLLYERE